MIAAEVVSVAESKIRNLEGYQNYSLSKASGATNWTLMRSHACKKGNIAFLQLVASVTNSQDGSAVILIQLPDDLHPAYAYETRFSSFEQAMDVNVNIETNGKLSVTRVPASKGGNIRMDFCYPTAS